MENRNAMPTTALILGVMSLLFIFFGMSLPIGALGVIAALLSRGRGSLDSRAKAGLAISMLGITVGICTLIYTYFYMQSAEFQTLLNQYMQVSNLA